MKRYFKAINIIILFFVFIVLGSFTLPMSWMRLTATFGESRGDHLHNGIDVFGDNFPVFAVMPGQIIFYWQQSDYPREQMFGYGNYVIMQHTDRYRTFYYHLQDGSVPKDLISVSEGQQVGLSGNSGHSGGPHLHLTIVDLKNNVSINPLLFMKQLNDRVRPVINKVLYTVEGKKNRIEMPPVTKLVRGTHIEILVDSYDKRDNMGNKYGNYIFSVSTNGRLFKRHQFDNLVTVSELGQDKKSFLKFDEVFTPDGIYKGGSIVIDRDITIEIVVADLNGNTNSTTRKIQVIN